MGTVASGQFLGIAFTLLVSPALIVLVNWEFVFYFFSALGFVWVMVYYFMVSKYVLVVVVMLLWLLWLLLVSISSLVLICHFSVRTPLSHPTITPKERQFILNSIANQKSIGSPTLSTTSTTTSITSTTTPTTSILAHPTDDNNNNSTDNTATTDDKLLLKNTTVGVCDVPWLKFFTNSAFWSLIFVSFSHGYAW